jgi:hypothetical protein
MRNQRMSDLVTVKIPPDVRDWVEKLARERETGMSAVIRSYLLDGMRRDGILC